MRAVLFHVGAEPFAVRTTAVVEVVPCIPPRAIPSAYPGLTGVINYRGEVVAVLDLCLLFGHGPCPVRLSSRILICDRAMDAPAGTVFAEGARRVGLLAQRVTRVVDLDTSAAGGHPGPRTETLRGLGRIVRYEGDLVQLVRVDELVPSEALAALSQAAAETA